MHILWAHFCCAYIFMSSMNSEETSDATFNMQSTLTIVAGIITGAALINHEVYGICDVYLFIPGCNGSYTQCSHVTLLCSNTTGYLSSASLIFTPKFWLFEQSRLTHCRSFPHGIIAATCAFHCRVVR